MEKVLIKLSDLTLDKENAKLHTDEQIEHLANSIKSFGFNDPIAVYGEKNLIVEGNGRYLALLKLGIEEVECIRLDFLSEEERLAYSIVHNSICLDTGLDPNQLKALLHKLSEDLDMSSYGVQIPVLEDTAEVVEDNYEEPDKLEIKIHSGEVFRLGEHLLICGDSRIKDTYTKLLGKEMVDLIITDPPYNVDYTGSTKAALKIANDNLSEVEFVKLLTDAFGCMVDVLKPGGAYYIWYGSNSGFCFEKALRAVGLKIRQQLIWVKNQFVLGRQDYHWRHEPRFYGWKDGAPHYFCPDRTQSTVLDEPLTDETIEKMKKGELVELCKRLHSQLSELESTVDYEDKPNVNDFHPTPKPIKITARMIVNSSRKGEIVCDMFGGGGTTLLACEQTGRVCRIAEIDEHYANVIIDRWEKFTGKKAEKVDGLRT